MILLRDDFRIGLVISY